MPGRSAGGGFEAFAVSLRKGPVSSVVLFAGPERFFREEGVRLIRKGIGGEIRPLRLHMGEDDPVPFLRAFESNDLFGEPVFGIVDGARDFLKRIGSLPRPGAGGCLVLRDPKPADKGLLSAVRDAGGAVVACDPVPDYRLEGWLAARARSLRIRIDAGGIRELMGRVGNDLDRLDAELAKLDAAVEGGIDAEGVATHVVASPRFAAWLVADAVADGDRARLVARLDALREQGMALVPLVAQLAGVLRRLRRAGRTGETPGGGRLPRAVEERQTARAARCVREASAHRTALLAWDRNVKRGHRPERSLWTAGGLRTTGV